MAIGFCNSRVLDSSGIDAIDKLSKLTQECRQSFHLAKYCTYEIYDQKNKKEQ